MKVWVYRSRNGNHGVFKGNMEGWVKARRRQDDDNGYPVGTLLEEYAEDGLDVSGSYASGRLFIDDGGELELFEVL